MKILKNGLELLEVTTGNTKLQANKNSKFLIWDIPSRITCPQATELCFKSCYAYKAERQYPAVLPFRQRNFEDSRKLDFVFRMIDTIMFYVNKPSWKNKQIFFRIHGSGDFYNNDYINKWIDICNISKILFPNVIFMAYTKSVNLINSVLEDKEQPSNLVLRYSIWNDTKPDITSWILENNIPYFTALTPEEIAHDNNKHLICIGDCSKCKACYYANVKNIAVQIH